MPPALPTDPAAPDRVRLAPERVRAEALAEISTSEVSPGERLDYWREMVLRLFADVQIAARGDEGFHGQVRSRYLDGMRFTVVNAASQAVERRHLEARERYEDCYFAVLMLSGSQQLEQGGRRVLLRPGDFAFYDGSRPHQLNFSRQWGEIVLNIPREMLESQLPAAQALTATRLGCERGAGALLRSHLMGLSGELGTLRRDALMRLSGLSVELIATAMAAPGGVGSRSPRSRELTRLRAGDWIERHLDDPQLDSARIGAALGVSARYLNKLFESEGSSLMRHVWARRLERCRDDLLDPACASLPVGDIALRWGFNDLSHFSRAFRARFGCSPRECRLPRA